MLTDSLEYAAVVHERSMIRNYVNSKLDNVLVKSRAAVVKLMVLNVLTVW